MTYLAGTEEKPVIGITIGDFNGIGPEVILKTLANRITKICTPVVFGSNKLLAKYKKTLTIDEVNFVVINNLNQIVPKKINIINCWEEDFELQLGSATAESGRCAYLSLSQATDALLAHQLDAIVTAPINKDNIQSSDFNFPGHTEYFAHRAHAKDSLMLLCNEGLRVGVVTGHIPLSEVARQCNRVSIVSKLDLLIQALTKDFDIIKPKIAVLGLNPHAGENGLLGKEEQNILSPLLETYKNKGHLVFGPFPADGFFGSGAFKKFDGVLAMYHDQGLIPFKTLAFENGVNFTAGLSFVRTSPDHGTAYDLAGKGIADETSFRDAIYMAVDIVKNRLAGKKV